MFVIKNLHHCTRGNPISQVYMDEDCSCFTLIGHKSGPFSSALPVIHSKLHLPLKQSRSRLFLNGRFTPHQILKNKMKTGKLDSLKITGNPIHGTFFPVTLF